MPTLTNDHKESLKKSMLFLGIILACDDYGIGRKELLGDVFNEQALEDAVCAPLEALLEAGETDDACLAVFRFLLLEAFPDTLKTEAELLALPPLAK